MPECQRQRSEAMGHRTSLPHSGSTANHSRMEPAMLVFVEVDRTNRRCRNRRCSRHQDKDLRQSRCLASLQNLMTMLQTQKDKLQTQPETLPAKWAWGYKRRKQMGTVSRY